MPGHMSVQYITQQPSPARAKQTNSAIFSAPSTDACSERANQLVSNTFRLLIITLRQARHQYEGYWRILKDTAWTLGSCSINGSNGCSSLPSIFRAPFLSALSYGRHGAYCSYLIITFLFTLQSRSWSWSRRRMLLWVHSAVSEWLIYMRYLS